MRNLYYGLRNLLVAYVAFMICRIVYVAENWNVFSGFADHNNWQELLHGCWMFDTSAILYLNALWILLILLPWHRKETAAYHRALRIVFTVLNAVGIIANLADAAYFPYTGRRTTATLFSEFSNEGNLTEIFCTELLRHWYLVVIASVMITGLYLLYALPRHNKKNYQGVSVKTVVPYYISSVLSLGLAVWLTIGGMRGGFTHAIRPITISNANQYVARPIESAIVLNTPFSIIRTLGKKTFKDPEYYTSEELDSIYSPIHTPTDSVEFTPRNVVILICESLAEEYYGFYNDTLEGGDYHGYTPFLDSLCTRSLTFEHNYANGRKSIDGMPSILSSIPMFVEPFFLTPASMNNVGGLARCLGEKGYESAFFHGAENGSMGFEAFARATGFGHYYGRTEYDADPQFNGEKDFDGLWAIWDEPFLQFFARHITSDLHEPFLTTIFTASSHHPFRIPEQYRDTFPDEGGHPMHKCIRYLDHSLRQFFAYAQQQTWYDHTLFVITGDHTNITTHPEYQTDLGLYCVPVIFFDPSQEYFPALHRKAIAQQIDIMPTLLSALHYDAPYIAFGCDLNTTPDSLTWAVNYSNGIYQYTQGDYLLQFDERQPHALYNISRDWMLHQDLKASSDSIRDSYELRLKAIIQSYMQRMNQDQLVIRE